MSSSRIASASMAPKKERDDKRDIGHKHANVTRRVFITAPSLASTSIVVSSKFYMPKRIAMNRLENPDIKRANSVITVF